MEGSVHLVKSVGESYSNVSFRKSTEQKYANKKSILLCRGVNYYCRQQSYLVIEICGITHSSDAATMFRREE